MLATEVADRLLDVKQTALKLGTPEKSFRNQIAKGAAPPSAIIMGRRKFRESDVDKWITEQFENQNNTGEVMA